jgi:hypothetical protein
MNHPKADAALEAVSRARLDLVLDHPFFGAWRCD